MGESRFGYEYTAMTVGGTHGFSVDTDLWPAAALHGSPRVCARSLRVRPRRVEAVRTRPEDGRLSPIRSDATVVVPTLATGHVSF